jgi:hypothetical protein
MFGEPIGAPTSQTISDNPWLWRFVLMFWWWLFDCLIV